MNQDNFDKNNYDNIDYSRSDGYNRNNDNNDNDNQDNYDQTEDKKLKFLSLLSLGSFLMFFYVSYAGLNGMLSFSPNQSTQSKPEVYGVTTDTSSVPGNVEIRINNSNPGEAYLELSTSDPVRVAGGEFYFNIEGSLDIEEVLCSNDFSCIQSEIEQDTLTLVALRPLDQAEESLRGNVRIATIFYDDSTAGELVMNSAGQESSSLLTIGGENNLLESTPTYLAIGSKY